LTVQAHLAASHAGRGWEQFTDAVINVLRQKNNIVYMLWGSYAQKKAALVDEKNNLVLKSVHPSPLSAYRGFFGCKHFSRANEYLQNHGMEPIDW
jgi:uracil-DNA glycosylase